jgi:hypothetical protein
MLKAERAQKSFALNNSSGKSSFLFKNAVILCQGHEVLPQNENE